MANDRWQILITETFSDSAAERMRRLGEVTVLDPWDDEAVRRLLPSCDALVLRTYGRVTRELLECAQQLKVIGRGGVGLENIDLPAARERGIEVVYTPAGATEAVADLTMGLIVAVCRHVLAGDADVRAGRFKEGRARVAPLELGEMTLGIVGMGRIGAAVGRRGQRGFGMRVLFHDIIDVGPLDFEATPVDADTLYAESNVVSLHVPLTDQTRHLIDGATLAKFRPGAVLINTARGAVVDAHALGDAVGSGHLGGAGIDVFDPEPPAPDHPLLTTPNILLSPHVGARTHSGLSGMDDVVDDVARVLEGKPPLYPAPLE